MTTTLVCLAALLMVVAVVIIIWSASEDRSNSISIENDSRVVNIRSARSGSISISFDPSGLPLEGRPADLPAGSDPAADEGATLLEEFIRPQTTAARKREIARALSGLGITFSLKEETPSKATSRPVLSTEMEEDGITLPTGPIDPFGDDD